MGASDVFYPCKDYGDLPLVMIRGGIAASDVLTHAMIVILMDFWLVLPTTDLAPRTVTTRHGVCSKFRPLSSQFQISFSVTPSSFIIISRASKQPFTTYMLSIRARTVVSLSCFLISGWRRLTPCH